MSKCKACGVEAFDKHYGIGYQVGRGELSPYERVNRIRKIFFDTDFYVDPQRAMLVTEAYKKYKNLPQVIKVAKAFEHILLNIDINIYPDEMIVGEAAAPCKASALFPEFSHKWVVEEGHNTPFDQRPNDKYFMKEGVLEQLDSITDFWEGQTVSEAIEGMLEWDEKKGSNMGRGMYLLNLYHMGGIGHYVADYEMLLNHGFSGLKAMVKKKLASLDCTTGEGIEKRNFYKAQLITADAATAYINRYAVLAEEKAAEETNTNRKAELQIISKNCRQVAEGPATNIWEAIQLWHFATAIILAESNGHSVSYGRMDQWLYPYYKADIESGRFSKEFIQELLEVAYIKTNCISKLRDARTAEANSGRSFGGESLTVGGVDKDGKDATNDLTFMMIDASIHTRMMTPWLCVRLHANSPWELKVKVAEAIRAGFGHPKIFNDESAIPAALAKGRTLDEARDYAVVGCVEIDTPGKEFGWHDAAYMNIAKVFEMAVNDGRCVSCGPQCPMHPVCGGAGKKLGPSTGSLADFTSIDEVIEAYDKQMEYWTDKMVAGIEAMDIAHRQLKPTPYASLLFSDCIESGKDLSAGGARYNHTGPQGNGIGTIADALSVINQLIFDEKKTTGQELLDAVNHNWEGYDALYALVNSEKVHHYGNDDDYADRFAEVAYNTYCKHIENRKNVRGGTYTPGVYGVSANVPLGMIQAASIDGRKAGEPISDNMGPVHTAASSHDYCGPTAIANSVTKMNHSRATNGTLLNWKFTPECLSGEVGRDNLINLMDVYFSQKGMHSQFNVISGATMRDAMEHPENYQDMLVRVAGYSAYFVDLSVPLQLDLINRTELSFE